MIRFDDEIQKIIIEEGIASDRTNRVLEKFAIDMYLKGFRDADTLMATGQTYSVTEVAKYVIKNKESYEV